MKKNTWIIKSVINFPLELKRTPGEKVPKKLEFNSRYDPKSETEKDGVRLFFEKFDSNERVDIQGVTNEYVFLVCEIASETAEGAITTATPYIEWSCDQLAFFTQFPIQIKEHRIYNKENPTEVTIQGMPHQPAKFRQTYYIDCATTWAVVPLMDEPVKFTSRARAVHRWYHKALAADYEIDRFIFLWICLEILCEIDETSIKKPYTNHVKGCGHVIEACPECGTSTEREVNGPTIKEFLISKLNVSENDAKKMWRFRQLVHGENDLTEDEASGLVHLVLNLRIAVNKGIKHIVNLADNNPPIVKPGVMMSALAITYTKTK